MSAYIHASFALPRNALGRIDDFGAGEALRRKRLPRIDRMALAVGSALMEGRPVQGVDLVVGTGYGSLSSTVDFLEAVAVRGPEFGSPGAFHESVHHAPAGQLAIALGLKGLALTTSCRELSGEAALHLAVNLLESGRSQQVLVLGLDEVVPALAAALQAFCAPWTPAECAAGLLLSREPSPLLVESVALGGTPAPEHVATAPLPSGLWSPTEGLLRAVDACARLDAGARTEVWTNAAPGGGDARVCLARASSC